MARSTRRMWQPPSARRAVRSTPPCASCRGRSARRCSRSIRSAGRSTISPNSTGPRETRRLRSRPLAQRYRRDLFRQRAGRGLPGLRAAGARSSICEREDFLAVIDGMEMDVAEDIRAPDWATLDLYCDRVASAVGRLSVRVFGMPRRTASRSRIISAARCNSPTSCATSTRTPAIGRLYLPREELRHAGIAGERSGERAGQPALGQGLRRGRRARAAAFRGGRQDHGAQFAPLVRAPRIMAEVYRVDPRSADRARDGRRRASAVRLPRLRLIAGSSALRVHLMARTVHIIGAGLAGLAAAVRLAQSRVTVLVHEADAQAGGRCRSYFDPAHRHDDRQRQPPAAVGQSCRAGFLANDRQRSRAGRAADTAEFPFVDLKSGERWTICDQ